MKDEKYLDIILQGFIENHDYLKEYFIREAQNCVGLRITLEEFFERCMSACFCLSDKREKDYKYRKEQLEIHKRFGLKNNLPITEIEENLNSISFDTYPLDISGYTNGKYTGYIYQEDIDFINIQFTKAVEHFSEKINKSGSKEMMEKGSVTDGKSLTLLSKFSPEQLKKLHKHLIKENLIDAKTKENDFIYFFSGKPLNGMNRIKWKKSKKMAYSLLQNICLDFKIKTINNCIETKWKPFDYNDKPKRDFAEIEKIIKLCDQ